MTSNNKTINVTQTFFPPLDEYNSYLKRIWDNKWLTNRGELTLELEHKLKTYLQSNDLIITTNGTLPIQIALKILGDKSEVITTPFSYVATTSSIIWENCKPVFVDINPDYLTIDETKIEQAITLNTRAILATHVFGNPCHIEIIESISKKHNIPVIYDAAHCFGVRYNGQSIFNYGTLSTCSFHATKIFHTGEGGAIFCNEKSLYEKIFYSHNFGHNGPLDFHGLGINAKISELQSAMGLAVFEHIDSIFKERKKICQLYDDNLNFTKLKPLKIRKNTQWNYCYYPIIFQDEKALLETQKQLIANHIIPRRYFYPSLNTIDYVQNTQAMPVSESIASRILCLPLYKTLSSEQAMTIITIINKTLC